MWIRNESDVQDVCNLYVVVTMFHYGTMVFMVPSASKKHHSSESGSDSDDSFTMKPKNKKKEKESFNDWWYKQWSWRIVWSSICAKNTEFGIHVPLFSIGWGQIWRMVIIICKCLDLNTNTTSCRSLDEAPRVPVFTGHERKPNQVQATNNSCHQDGESNDTYW